MLAANCGLRTDGTLYCRGMSADPPSGIFASVWGNNASACAIRSDATLECWGDGIDHGQFLPPSGAFLKVAMNNDDGCAIRADHTAACWAMRPMLGTYADLSVRGHRCGVKMDGSVSCLDNSDDTERLGAPGPFVQISSSGSEYCAIDFEGAVSCDSTRVGDTTAPPSGHFISVAKRNVHDCALDIGGRARCWSDDNYDEKLEAPEVPFSAIGIGGNFGCGIRSTDEMLVCWGRIDGLPVNPPTGTFKALSPSNIGGGLCGIRTDGTIACWPEMDEPWFAPPAGTFEQIAGYAWYGCAIASDMTLHCWGANVR
jgi:hypothetical protein